MTSILERAWRIARGGDDPAVRAEKARAALGIVPAEAVLHALPESLTNPTAAEFVAQQRAWLAWYDVNHPELADRMRRACLYEALAFLERFGDARPAPREPDAE